LVPKDVAGDSWGEILSSGEKDKFRIESRRNKAGSGKKKEGSKRRPENRREPP